METSSHCDALNPYAPCDQLGKFMLKARNGFCNIDSSRVVMRFSEPYPGYLFLDDIDISALRTRSFILTHAIEITKSAKSSRLAERIY